MDSIVSQAEVESGRSIYQIPCRAAMNSVEWNPKYNLLAFAGDDKNKYSVDEGELPIAADFMNSLCSIYIFIMFESRLFSSVG